MLASKNLEKTEIGATWGLGIAAPEPLGPRDGSKSTPGGLKTAPRALWEASRRPQELRLASRRPLREASTRPQELSARLQDDSHRLSSFSTWSFPQEQLRTLLKLFREPHQAYLNIFRCLRISSASPKVSVQNNIRKSYSIQRSSNKQTQGQLAPCMAMHGFTLVYIYIYISAGPPCGGATRL